MTWFTPKHPHAMQLSDEDPGLVWLEMDPAKDPEAAARLDKIKPFTQYGRTPVAGNIAKAAHGVSLTINAQYYLVKEELDSELVYLMAKWLGENYDTYKDKSDLATAMDINLFRNLLDNTFIPVHEGVIKYLKEVGMWSAADDERQATNVALFQAYEDAWKAALATADEEMVMVDPEQERWLNIWEEYKSTIPNRIKIEFIAAPSGGPPPGGPPPGGKKPGGPPPGGKKP
jgi:hypothetical protein